MRASCLALMSLISLVACSNSEYSISTLPASTTVVDTSGPKPPSSSLPSTTTTTFCEHPLPTVTTFRYATYPNRAERFTSLDVHLPAGCGPFPILFWVHGGAWVGGDKGNPEVIDRAELAAGNGFALVSTNYRLANQFGKAQWPEFANDLADAIDYIVRHSAKLRLDATKISLLGHSAGGHLVSIVTADPSFLFDRNLEPDTVDCVIANDTEGYRLRDQPTAYPLAVENAFGTDQNVLDDASPSVQIERNGAPTTRYLIITRGPQRRQEVASEFAKLINDAEGSAEILIAGTYSHDEVNSFLGEPGETIVTPKVSQFLQSCLTTIVE